MCPRRCGADRFSGKRGVCGADNSLVVARAALHAWEEPPLSVGQGSGAVFFSNCGLRCVYCQNSAIAQGGQGKNISQERLAEIFLELQAQGAANINLVTATHYTPHVVQAIRAARSAGLHIPMVLNTSGYECVETLEALSPYIDVYLADFKYWKSSESNAAVRYSRTEDYFEVATEALDFMVEAAGEAAFDTWDGQTRLVRGVVLRHLLLPGRLSESQRLLAYLWQRYGSRVLYSIMNQYTPVVSGLNMPELTSRIPFTEYEALLDYCDSIGLTDYFWQDGQPAEESFIPAFDFTGV